MENKLWLLFKKTGDIRIYNLLGKVEGCKKDGNNKSRRSSSKGNKL